MSAIVESTNVLMLQMLKRLGFVGASSANPEISASNLCNRRHSHEPLKPVWPVIRTFLFFQNDVFMP